MGRNRQIQRLNHQVVLVELVLMRDLHRKQTVNGE
jgi:hypothetical protein